MTHFYAATNADLDCNEFSYGFANTWVAVAFTSKAHRNKVLSETRALKAHAITRVEAIKLTKTNQGRKWVYVYGTDSGCGEPEKLVLWESDFAC